MASLVLENTRLEDLILTGGLVCDTSVNFNLLRFFVNHFVGVFRLIHLEKSLVNFVHTQLFLLIVFILRPLLLRNLRNTGRFRRFLLLPLLRHLVFPLRLRS